MDWRTASERAWADKYQAASLLLKTNGDTGAGSNDKTEEALRVSQWIARQRTLHRQGKLSREQIEMLNTLNITQIQRHRNTERTALTR